MSRSGMEDSCDYELEPWELPLHQAQTANTIKGKRGQALLQELRTALDAMPVKELGSGHLEIDGCYCTLGVLGKARSLDMTNIDPECPEQVAEAFNARRRLTSEIVWQNDDAGPYDESLEDRWTRMRGWVNSNIKEVKCD